MPKKPTKAEIEERNHAINKLRALFDPILASGKRPEIKTVLRHVSKSGMRREISLIYAAKDAVTGECNTINLDYFAATVMGDRIGKHGGIVIDGCGMDMGFALVYNLGMTLYGRDCGHTHSERNGEPDRNGGYALTQRWL